jgi:4-amino-4-deoxy-L-arabinose transferase
MRPLIVPDETRYAEIPREMIESGDWVVPRLNGLLYFEKPVLGYWANAVSILVFGENAFAVRLPSALAAAGVALLVFLMARRFSKNKRLPLLATAVQLTFMLSFFVGTFSVLDSMLTFALTGALVFFFFAVKSEKLKEKYLYLIVFGFFCGLAFLMKGFLAFAVPVVVIGPYMVWEKRWKELMVLPWIPLVLVVIVALPWSLAVHFKNNDFWNYFFWVEHYQRFFSSAGSQHPEPFWYYIPALLGGAFPWTLLVPATVAAYKKDDLKSSLTRYALCWAFIPIIFFSISSGKLATYILPCFPPMAILFAVGLDKYFEKENERKLFNYPLMILSCLIGIAAVGFLINQVTGWPKTLYNETETLKWILAFVAFLSCGTFLFFSARNKETNKKLFYFCIAPALIMFLSHFLLPERIIERKAPSAFLKKHQARIPEGALIISYKNMLRAVCWEYKRNDLYLFMQTGEFKYGLKQPDSKHRYFQKTEELADFIRERSKKEPVFLLIRTKIFKKDCAGILPEAKFSESVGEFTIAEY